MSYTTKRHVSKEKKKPFDLFVQDKKMIYDRERRGGLRRWKREQ
jgi:hypothetical protein